MPYATNSQNSEKKKSNSFEKALIASEIRYRRLFESAKDGILILNAETGMIVDVNPFLIKLLGYSKDSFIKKTIWEIGYFKDIIDSKDKFRELQLDKYVRYEDLPLKAANGRKINVEFVSNVYIEDNKKVVQCNIRDITERKRLETKLLTATEIAKLGYWEFDVESDNFIFDEQYYRLIHGSSTEKQGGNLMSAADFVRRLVHPDDSKRIGIKLQEAINSPDSDYFGQAEGRVFRDNGDITNVLVQFKVVKDDAGRTIKVVGINQDITEHKLAKEKINSLAKFTSENPDPVLQISRDGRLLYANEASYSFFPGKLEIGKPVPVFLQNVVNDVFKQKIIQKIEVEYNKRIFSIHAVPILESNYTNLYIRDITKRKLDEKEITLLAHALKGVKECVSITDLKDKIIFVNQSFLKTYGYLENGLIGENINIVRSLNNDAKLMGKILPYTAKGGWKGELWNKRKDGSEFLIYLSTTIINDANGKPLGLIGVASDITEQKHFEQELIRAKEKAEESDRLKSAFLANMSHEIRTPMNGILGFTELLRTPRLKGSEQQAFIDIIEKSGTRMLNIINDIINISRIESGQIELSVSDVNIKDLTRDIFDFFKTEAEKKELNFSYKNILSAYEVVTKTDMEKVCAVLTNLVKNALKFTQTGSIELGFEKKDKLLEFFVKDTGSGIPLEQKEIIFERFRQGSDSLTRNYEGAGLGLAISKAYVEMLGGKIWLESKLGQGSTFRFTIPYLNGFEEKKTTSLN